MDCLGTWYRSSFYIFRKSLRFDLWPFSALKTALNRLLNGPKIFRFKYRCFRSEWFWYFIAYFWLQSIDSLLPIVNWKNNPELNHLIESLFGKSEREILGILRFFVELADIVRSFIKDFFYKNIKVIPDEFESILQSESSLEKLERLVKYAKSLPYVMYKHEDIIVFLIAFINALLHK